MENRIWPPHYSAADIDLIQRVPEWIKAHEGYSQAALARRCRISESSLTQILKGTYVSSPSPLLAKVEQGMANVDEAQGGGTMVVETSMYRLAVAACGMARRYHNFAVLTGNVGTGKTFALKHYAATHPNTHLVEATPTMTMRSMVKMLGRVVAGMDGRGCADERFQAVVDVLKGTDSLLILDEAETLSSPILHTLRRLRDLTGVGIVLAGTEHLHGLIKPEHGAFGQIRSRTGFWPAPVKAITRDDAAALIQGSFVGEEVTDEVVARLFAYSEGSARMLVEGLIAGIREYRRGMALDVKLVDAVAVQALCLPLLPKKAAT